MKFTGKVIKYGDNVDTDVIIPARYLNTSDHKELASHCMEDLDLTFQEMPAAGKEVANIYLNGVTENGTVVQLSLVPMGGTVCERISVNTEAATYFAELPFWKNCDSPGSLIRIVGAEVTHRISGDSLFVAKVKN